MPDNPKCVVLNDARRRAIRSRWKEAASAYLRAVRLLDTRRWAQGVGEFFAVCAASDFLTGKAPPQRASRRSLLTSTF